MLAPYSLPLSDAKARSTAAKQWLASLSLPAPIRIAVTQLADSVATGHNSVAAESLAKLLLVAAHQIDEASATELRALMAELKPVE